MNDGSERKVSRPTADTVAWENCLKASATATEGSDIKLYLVVVAVVLRVVVVGSAVSVLRSWLASVGAFPEIRSRGASVTVTRITFRGCSSLSGGQPHVELDLRRWHLRPSYF